MEKIFNYLFLFLPGVLLIWLLFRRKIKIARYVILIYAILLIFPFIFVPDKMDRTNWSALAAAEQNKNVVFIFSPISNGPTQTSSQIYEKPSWQHFFGTDQVGRDVFARMLYGSRISLAVGFFATLISLTLGTLIGL